MENQLPVINKKSVYIKFVTILIILGALVTLITLVLSFTNMGYLLNSNLFLNPGTHPIKLGLLLIELIILPIYFFKLLHLKNDVILWTNITFVFLLSKLFFNILFGKASILPHLMTPWIIVSIILIIIWVTFRNHLKKIQKFDNSNIIFSNTAELKNENK